MGKSVEELNILVKAKNLSKGELKKVQKSFRGIDSAINSVNRNTGSLRSSTLSFIKGAAGLTAVIASYQILKTIIEKSVLLSLDMNKAMFALKTVGESTGKDTATAMKEISSSIGGLNTRLATAQGLTRGFTTELTVTQLINLKNAVENASIAMGENFSEQFPMIIKAVKQLNPAILDNIGVTIRLDKLNKQIRDGYFGLNKEVNEATQQNAIYQEVIKQTAKFQGLTTAALEESSGKVDRLSTSIDNYLASLGSSITETDLFRQAIDAWSFAIDELTIKMDLDKILASNTNGVKELQLAIFILTGDLGDLERAQESINPFFDQTGSRAASFNDRIKELTEQIEILKGKLKIVTDIPIGGLGSATSATNAYSTSLITLSAVASKFAQDMSDFSLTGGVPLIDPEQFTALGQLEEELNNISLAMGEALVDEQIQNDIDIFNEKIGLDMPAALREAGAEFGIFQDSSSRATQSALAGFSQLSAVVQNFFSKLKQGNLDFFDFLGLALQIGGLFSTGGIFGAGGLLGAAPAVAGLSAVGVPTLPTQGITGTGGGMNIQTVNMISQAKNIEEVSKELEDLSQNGATNVQVDTIQVQR